MGKLKREVERAKRVLSFQKTTKIEIEVRAFPHHRTTSYVCD
jgi:hypothetical protein